MNPGVRRQPEGTAADLPVAGCGRLPLEAFYALVDDGLHGDELRTVDDHVRRCAACSRAVAAVEQEYRLRVLAWHDGDRGTALPPPSRYVQGLIARLARTTVGIYDSESLQHMLERSDGLPDPRAGSPAELDPEDEPSRQR